LIFQYDEHESLCFWNIKINRLIFCLFLTYKLLFFCVFSPAARGSGSEQLSPILLAKPERSLTLVSIVKV
jgi:hypothetical protein